MPYRWVGNGREGKTLGGLDNKTIEATPQLMDHDFSTVVHMQKLNQQSEHAQVKVSRKTYTGWFTRLDLSIVMQPVQQNFAFSIPGSQEASLGTER